jgi:hypothetical protein
MIIKARDVRIVDFFSHGNGLLFWLKLQEDFLKYLFCPMFTYKIDVGCVPLI